MSEVCHEKKKKQQTLFISCLHHACLSGNLWYEGKSLTDHFTSPRLLDNLSVLPWILHWTQEGKMGLSCSLGTTHCVLQQNFPWKPYNNKSFLDQAWGQDGWIWHHSFFGPESCKKIIWLTSSHLDLKLGQ